MSVPAISRVGVPRIPDWPVLRRRLALAGLLMLALAAAYFLWFRDSAFVEVREVEVTGTGGDTALEAALVGAAEGQSTLDLDVAALEAAVADDPEIADLTALADFPHALRITVELRPPAGYVEEGGGAVIAADGTVLATGVERPDGLPTIMSRPGALGERAEGPTLAAAQVLGSSPPELAEQVESGRVDPERGPTVNLAGGIELRFGDGSALGQKWRAAVAVLADPEFSGAGYLDLSVPSRPVSG